MNRHRRCGEHKTKRRCASLSLSVSLFFSLVVLTPPSSRRQACHCKLRRLLQAHQLLQAGGTVGLAAVWRNAALKRVPISAAKAKAACAAVSYL